MPMTMFGFDAMMALFFASIVLVLKPGPYVLSISGLAVTGQWGKIISFLGGSWLGGTLTYLLLLTGLSYITRFDLGFIFFLLKAMAAAWFIWLGVKGLIQKIHNEQSVGATEDKFNSKTFFENFAAGFILTASNPYHIIFVTGAIPILMHQTVFTVYEMLVIRGIVILASIVATAAYVIPALYLHHSLKGKQTGFMRIFASILMIGIGLYMGYTAIMADDLMQSGILG